MSKGYEIIRRLLLTASWATVIFFTIIVPIVGIDKLDYVPYSVAIKNDRQADLIEGWILDPAKHDITKIDKAKSELEEYRTHKKENARVAWLCIFSPILIIPVGFGVHKLINWILVYKND
jgi:hypothetical protein